MTLHLYVRIHNTVWRRSYLCTYLNYLNRILTLKPSESSCRPHVKTESKRTVWLNVVADCAKCSVPTLAETFYHALFLQYLPNVITHIPPFLHYLFRGVSEALVTRNAKRMRHIVICGLSGSTIFFRIIL